MTMLDNQTILGAGIYSIPEASRLVDAPQSAIRSWLSNANSEKRLWSPDFYGLSEHLELSFLDLMEVRIVFVLRQQGLSLQYIRKALAKAHAEFGKEHPFSTGKFRTDGKRIFWETAKDLAEDDPSLEDLISGQFVFWGVVEKSFKSVDIEGGLAQRWWPQNNKKTIVIDPKRSFGQPILNEFGIPTRRIQELSESNLSPSEIGRYFEIDLKFVNDALKFESTLLH